MTILDCSVAGCMYNEANCCHKGNIKVEGEDAKAVSYTHLTLPTSIVV